MIKSTLSILIVIVCFFQSQRSTAQADQDQQYLYEIGLVDSLYSGKLDEQRLFWVHLPDGYDPNGHTKYPVVYVLDGSVHMKGLETVYNYYRGHHLPDMILVGISNGTNRTRDLTTSQINSRRGAPVSEETGGAENFTFFIENELIPYVDKKYPTTPYRTLIGHSYAGLFTINAFINHTHLFENYIAIDPSIEWDGQSLLKQAKSKLQTGNFKGKSLFVSLASGQLHLLDGSITMSNVMQDTSEYSLFSRSIIEFSRFAQSQKQNGLNFSWKNYPDDYHWTVSLPSMQDGLITQFEWYQLDSATKYSNPDTPLDELLDLLNEREATLSSHFGYPTPPVVEELFNQAGYMYLQFGQLEKSRTFFEMSLAYYPESANSNDSMADYYEAQGDYLNAVKHVTKAYELSGNDYHKERMQALKAKITKD